MQGFLQVGGGISEGLGYRLLEGLHLAGLQVGRVLRGELFLGLAHSHD